jgi:hypothetical protein
MIVGPFVGGWVYMVNPYYPFILAGCCGVVAYGIIRYSGLLKRLPA